ncbi:MAG TPA: alpha/beta hydrolase [Solirubrobacteraceae bacterium]|nr:alpha/beta hydrolase [Solirubrobacteraceae bacterium]
MTRGSTLLLIHGAWCGGWVWEPLLARLRERGVRVEVIAQLPSAGVDAGRLEDLQADVGRVRSQISAAGGSVVLCGHSYAGMLMSELANHPAVERSVYLAAFWPVKGQSLLDLVGGRPPDWIVGREDGSLAITDDADRARDVLFGDLAPDDAARAHERLVLQSAASFMTPSGAPARSHPCTYVLCTDDQCVPPALQEAMSAPADDVVRLQSAHFAQLSHPGQLAQVLTTMVAGELPAAR